MSILKILQMLLNWFNSLPYVLTLLVVFFPELAKILRRVCGDRTIEEFAIDANISIRSAKRFLRGVLPSPRLAYKIAKDDKSDIYIRAWEAEYGRQMSKIVRDNPGLGKAATTYATALTDIEMDKKARSIYE